MCPISEAHTIPFVAPCMGWCGCTQYSECMHYYIIIASSQSTGSSWVKCCSLQISASVQYCISFLMKTFLDFTNLKLHLVHHHNSTVVYSTVQYCSQITLNSFNSLCLQFYNNIKVASQLTSSKLHISDEDYIIGYIQASPVGQSCVYNLWVPRLFPERTVLQVALGKLGATGFKQWSSLCHLSFWHTPPGGETWSLVWQAQKVK